MRYCLFLLLFIVSCHDSPPPELKISAPELRSPRKNLVVTITGENRVYIKSREIPLVQIDSLLKQAIDSTRDQLFDSIVVVINADTATHYGIVFKVMRAAKKFGVKVVASVETN
jgi:biopolymer transport protein ExbD